MGSDKQYNRPPKFSNMAGYLPLRSHLQDPRVVYIADLNLKRGVLFS